ncbi:RlpA-like double-psi beta-barrel-protein domain-containing protein-containing protein [Panaeolus papilionaceus]|nr:RlpA-like double-psi beta-barrel-protein domain-containing protein-containing protein [Panaeolus papilionaceus]
MFSPLTVVVSLLALSASTSALVAPRATPPKGWDTAALEPYDTYHTRYLALQCQNKHKTTFFDECCRPMLAKQKLSSRPAQCTPKGSAVNVDDQDCDDDDDDDIPVTPAPSKAKAPTTTAKAAAKATPAPVKKPATSPSPSPKAKAAAPASNSGNSSLNTGGFATFFYQNGNAGACGNFHSDNDMIAAIDAARYGDLGKKSSLCGKKVTLTNTKNGKSVTVTIADACPTCKNSNSIDLSVGAFKAIAPLSDGLVPITWKFV